MKNSTLIAVLLLVGVLIGTGTNARGQGYSGLGVDFSGFGGGSGQGSVFPIRIKLSGTLNPTALQKDSIKVATLSVNGYLETYKFEVMQAEPVDDKQLPRIAIIPRIVSTSYDYRIFGSQHHLSKIGQAVPNTPITLVGFLRQRNSELTIESIETINAHSPSPVGSLTSEELPPPSSDTVQ